jgi:hypothetical protein
MCVWLSLSRFGCRSLLSVCVCGSHSVGFICRSLSACVWLSLSRFGCRSLLSVCVCVALTQSVWLSLSVCVCAALTQSCWLSLSVCLCVALTQSVWLSLSVCLCVALPQSLPIALCLCFCISVGVWFSFGYRSLSMFLFLYSSIATLLVPSPLPSSTYSLAPLQLPHLPLSHTHNSVI